MLKIQEVYPGLAVLLFTGILWVTPATGAEDHLKGFDANGDGKVTFEEVMRHVEPSIRKGFDALDRNHDGALSGEDFNDFHRGMQKLEDWLNELLKPFIPSKEERDVQA